MSKFNSLRELLDSDYRPPAIADAEYLARVRLQIHALIDKALDLSPDKEREAGQLILKLDQGLVTYEAVHDYLGKIWQAAEQRYPGITAAGKRLVVREAELAAKVPGAWEDGGVS